MQQDELPEHLLASVDQTRRAFVRRLVIGSGFASPLVSSFAMGGIAHAQSPGLSNTGGPIIGNLLGPVRSNTGGPITGNVGIPIGSNTVSVTPSPAPSPSPPPSPPPAPPSPPPSSGPPPSPGPAPGPSGAVPEPASALLLGSGVALAGGAVLAQRVRARVRHMLEKWADNGDTTP